KVSRWRKDLETPRRAPHEKTEALAGLDTNLPRSNTSWVTEEAGMSEMRRQKRILRRIGAVLAGVLVIIILSIATDTMLLVSGIFPPFGQPMADTLFVVALAYRCLFSVVGSTSHRDLRRIDPCSTPSR